MTRLEDDLLKVVRKLELEFDQRQEEVVYKKAYESFKAFVQVIETDGFKGVWGKREENMFYEVVGIKDGADSSAFRFNIALAYILKELRGSNKKKGVLKVKEMPKVNIYPRPNLALNKNDYPFEDLELFHSMLRRLIVSKPNYSDSQERISLWLMLRLIAVDGVLIGNADSKICKISVTDIHLGHDCSWIKVPIGSSARIVLKQYPISKDTAYGFKVLLNRRKKRDIYIFPESLHQVVNKKKTYRRTALEKILRAYCFDIDPHQLNSDRLDMKWWIQMSRQSMEVTGVPYVAIANMRNKLRVAQLNFFDEEKRTRVNSTHLAAISCSHEVQLFRLIQKDFKAFAGGKVRVIDIRDRLIRRIDSKMKKFPNLERVPQKWIQLFDWFIYLLECEEHKDLSVATLYAHTSSLPGKVFEHIQHNDMCKLTEEDWLNLASKVSKHPEYAASTRTNSLTHLKRFHTYLRNTYSTVPKVIWSRSDTQVYRSIAEGRFVSQGDFEELIKAVPQDSVERVAMFFAFYGGLRCEEIFYLNKRDLKDLESVPVLSSKTRAGYRVIPLASFLEAHTESGLRAIVNQVGSDGDRLMSKYETIRTPKDLSKKVSRMLKRLGRPELSLHSFRHSFASVQLIRYFVMVEPEMKEYILHCLPKFSKTMLEGNMMKELAFVFGGSIRAQQYESLGKCLASPTDLCTLSKLLGHVSRQTTLENYCNSFFWLQRYWMLKREESLCL